MQSTEKFKDLELLISIKFFFSTALFQILDGNNVIIN